MGYKSFKVKLKPTQEQIDIFKRSWKGYCKAYNYSVAREIRYYDEITRQELLEGSPTQRKFIPVFSLTKEWVRYKATLSPENLGYDIYTVGAKTTEGAVIDCYSACKYFFDHAKGKPGVRPKQRRKAAYSSSTELNSKGKPARWLYTAPDGTHVYSLYYRTGGPRFKHDSDRPSFPVAYQGLTVTDKGVYIQSMFGRDKSHSLEESFFKFARPNYIPTGKHRDENGTKYMDPRISFDGVDWWFSVSTDFAPPTVKLNKGKIIGIDLGVKNLAVLDDGTIYSSPKDIAEYRKLEKKVNHLKSLLDHKKNRIKKLNTEQGTSSKNYQDLKRKYCKAQNRLNNIKEYHLHQVSRAVVDQLPEVIAMEDLTVDEMLKNKPVDPQKPKKKGERKREKELHREIASTGMAGLQSKIAYKAAWCGINVQKVPAPYTSKTCHVCGYIYYGLTLRDRYWTCPECGVHHDRDVNAAINIRNKAIEQLNNPPKEKVKKSRPRIPRKKKEETN